MKFAVFLISAVTWAMWSAIAEVPFIKHEHVTSSSAYDFPQSFHANFVIFFPLFLQLLLFSSLFFFFLHFGSFRGSSSADIYLYIFAYRTARVLHSTILLKILTYSINQLTFFFKILDTKTFYQCTYRTPHSTDAGFAH